MAHSCQSCLRWPGIACACLCSSGEVAAVGTLWPIYLGYQHCRGQLLFLVFDVVVVLDVVAAVGHTVQYVMQISVM